MTERAISGMRRRDFVKTLGGGIAVLVALPRISSGSALAQGRGYPTDINAYLHIAADGQVTLYSGKIEMGQGIVTSLSQMAAEELRVGMDAMRIVMGDTASCPFDAGTWGSLSTRFFGPAVRAACAKARLVLTDLGAQQLGVPRAAVTAENGAVFVTAEPSRRATYGQLAQGRAITHTVNEDAVLRQVDAFTVMGQSIKRVDGREKVTGAAKYAGDVRRPGMVYARLLRPPAHGATLRSADTSAVSAMRVELINQDGLVAVLAEDPETAERAIQAVRADWDVPAATVDPETIYDHLLAVGGDGEARDRAGDVVAGRGASARVFEQTYRHPYVAHAPMEPHTALAEFANGTMTIWASTQSPFGLQGQVARELGLAPANVRVITPWVGGGFGGKSAAQQAMEAARLAKLSGKPVMVAWTRAEEFFYDTFDPASVVQVSTGLDAAGKITFWDYHVTGAGSRGSDVFYDIPNKRVRVSGEWGDTSRGPQGMHPFNVGPWRAPGANTNRFAAESQMDLMAAAAGVDPLEFRLRHLTDQRMAGVLRAAARAYGWESAAHPRRGAGGTKGRGLACGIDAGTYVVHIAEVTVDRASGAVKVDRVVCAQDMGIVVNPEGAHQQMEGAVTMGLGYCLAEEVKFSGGAVQTANFDTYNLPRFSWLPRIETVIVKNDAVSPQGGGEPGIISMGGAVANAVFDATGARMTRLPLTPERVLAAMGRAVG